MNALGTTVGPFAMPTQLIVLFICAGFAAVIGHFVGRRQKASIGGTLADMALAKGGEIGLPGSCRSWVAGPRTG